MALFSKTCSSCGYENSLQAGFCAQCGARLGEIKCGVCGTTNSGNARFCKECGKPLDVNTAPEIRNNRWARQGDDFAVRVDAADLQGLFRRGIIVDIGTNAVLVDNGANRGTLAPGAYTLDSLDKRLLDWINTGVGSHVSVLLVDVAPTDLEFSAGGVFTNDPIRIGALVRLQVQVEEPGRFLANMMGGRERFTRLDLSGYLYPEVTQVLEAWVAQHSVDELAEDLSLKPKLELALEEALKSTFRQSGLKFINVRATQLNLEHLEHIKGIRSKYALQISEAEAEIEGRDHALGLLRERSTLELAEETLKVEDEEKRIALYERMRKAVSSGKMDEVRSQAEFEAFLDDMDRQKLLREKERAEMLQAWKEEGEDRELARKLLLAKLQIEQEYQLKKAGLSGSGELEQLALDNEIALARKRADFEFGQKKQILEQELWLQREQDRIKDERAKSEIEMNSLRARQELADDAASAELGMKLLAEMKRIRRLDEEERLRIQREDELARKKAALEEEMKRFEMAEQQRQAEREHELKKIEALSRASAEAVIAMAGPEQAKYLASLKRTEVFKDMSDDQIMAVLAAESPDLAQAIQEKFRALGQNTLTEQERALYQRLMDAQKDELQRANTTWDKVSEREKEMTKHALDRMADVAQSFARGQNIPPIIVGASSGGRQLTSNGPVSGESKTCPNCGRFVAVEARHCEHCGHKFEGMS
ncbi:MAG: zinc ribbon domain-containing protein [Anaerolineales bacterium]